MSNTTTLEVPSKYAREFDRTLLDQYGWACQEASDIVEHHGQGIRPMSEVQMARARVHAWERLLDQTTWDDPEESLILTADRTLIERLLNDRIEQVGHSIGGLTQKAEQPYALLESDMAELRWLLGALDNVGSEVVHQEDN